MVAGGDSLVEAGQSDELKSAVYVAIRDTMFTGLARRGASTHVYGAVDIVVDRLRAGGISDLVIRKCLCGDGFAEPEQPDTIAPFRDKDL